MSASEKEIEFAKDLPFPLDIVTQKIAVLARSGAGKSYAAGKIVEGLLAAAAQVVVVDPVGVWFGLRLAKDGKSPGFAIPVLGGQHGDIPLEPTAGAVIAGVVANNRASLVLDVSDMNGAEQRRFITDFAIALHKAKKAARSPVLIVWEECQDFVPQRVGGDTARMVGAMEKLIKQGRNFGIGTMLISQRPQAVNKDVLNQTEVVIALQTTGPHERKAIKDWVTHQAVGNLVNLDELPFLPIGTAFVWSPSWMQIFQRVRVLPKTTFDSSSTPTFGKTRAAAELAPVDMETLRGEMAATIEKAKSEDPKLLRQSIATLQAKVRDLEKRPSTVERVEVPVIEPSHIARIEDLALALSKAAEDLHAATADLRLVVQHKVGGGANRPLSLGHRPSPALSSVAPRVQRAATQARQSESDERLGSGERAVLTAVAQYRDGVERDQLSVLTGYKRSTRDAYLQRLGGRGLVEFTSSGITATDAGLDALGANFEPLPTGEALRAYWIEKLPEGERKVLEVLVSAYPAAVAGEAITDGTGYKRSTRDAYLQRLGSRRLVERVGRGEVRASEVLFSEGFA